MVKEENKKNGVKKVESAPHIIRRNVKVINSDDEKNVIEQITTNISGEIKKVHSTERKDSTMPKDNSYSKEGLGVVKPKYGTTRNRTSNVVVTRNGKPVEEKVVDNIVTDTTKEVTAKKENENTEISSAVNNKDIKEEKLNVKEEPIVQQPNRPYNNYNRDNNGERRPYNNNYNRDNNGGERRPYNNNFNRDSNGENRPYNNNYNRDNNGERRPYNNNFNRDNSNGERRPYNNNYNRDNNGQNRPYNNNYNRDNNGQNRPYNNNYNRDNNGQNRPYNNNYNRDNNGQNRPYNNNFNRDNNGQNRPYNNNFNRDNNGQNRPYNNNFNRDNNGQNRPYNNNFNRNSRPQMNQVDKFMKQTDSAPIEQKETRDYSLTLIDKKKYNNSNATQSNDGKKNQINKNELREKHTRVSTTKLRGLEVNSSGSMLDLYERDSDSFKKSKKRKDKKVVTLNQTKIIPMTEVKLPETMTVKEFAEAIKKQSSEIIKKLFGLGILATVNQEIDFDTAFLIAEEFGITAEKQVIITDEEILFDESEDDENEMISRPPIVVVMGHVDHGKTSLLDKIRSARVVSGEAGGITQHIGAYKVPVNGREICFMDTPGHEAFTEMRARGAQITDIAIIVVAADDGIKPQTIEAIDHAKAAGVSIIVAINKIDKPTANVERVKQELLECGLVAEEWGGDTICVPISAMTGEGIDTLLEMILLTADIKDLKANPNKQAKGTVIEARLDKNIGTVASVIVQRGELNISDTIVVGDMIGKVRAMKDDKGKRVKKAGPSTPVEIIGLPSVPQTGDIFYEVENEKVAKHLVDARKADSRRNLIKQGSKVTLDELFGQIKEGEIKDLNIIVKADVQGTLEALKNSLEKISNEEVKVRIIHASTGGIKESDVTLASVSNAIIIGFNVRPEAIATAQADKEKVDMRLYRVIYDAINDVEAAMKGMLKPTFKEVLHGTAEVRATFKISNVGTICGCYVKSGTVLRNTMARLVRDNIIIADVKLESLKREKDDAKEVREGYECGIKLENFNDVKEGDMIECYEMVEEKRK